MPTARLAFGDDGLAVGSRAKADRRRAALSDDVVGEAQPRYGSVGIAGGGGGG